MNAFISVEFKDKTTKKIYSPSSPARPSRRDPVSALTGPPQWGRAFLLVQEGRKTLPPRRKGQKYGVRGVKADSFSLVHIRRSSEQFIRSSVDGQESRWEVKMLRSCLVCVTSLLICGAGAIISTSSASESSVHLVQTVVKYGVRTRSQILEARVLSKHAATYYRIERQHPLDRSFQNRNTRILTSCCSSHASQAVKGNQPATPAMLIK